MKPWASRILLLVSLTTAIVGVVSLKARFDIEAQRNAKTLLKVLKCGPATNAYLYGYARDHLKPHRIIFETRAGWFDSQVPITLSADKADRSLSFRFLADVQKKFVIAADDKSQAFCADVLTGRLLIRTRTDTAFKLPSLMGHTLVTVQD